jgi:hypothetical protein
MRDTTGKEAEQAPSAGLADDGNSSVASETQASDTPKRATPKRGGAIRAWIDAHPNIWEFILFNVLSNISTITRFVVAWVGTAVFVSAMGLTAPFSFLIFNYTSAGSHGLGGFLTFLLAEVLAQIVNFHRADEMGVQIRFQLRPMPLGNMPCSRCSSSW